MARILARRKRGPDSRGPFRLLTGAAVGAPAEDQLQHEAIASAIRDTPASEPLGIALYGAWGQGKTTIGELLRVELAPETRSQRYVFVRIDAWKYAHEGERQPLRRHFLIAAYQAAGLTARALELKRLFGAEFSGTFGRNRSPLRKSFRLTAWELAVLLLVAAAVVGALSERSGGIHVFEALGPLRGGHRNRWRDHRCAAWCGV